MSGVTPHECASGSSPPVGLFFLVLFGQTAEGSTRRRRWWCFVTEAVAGMQVLEGQHFAARAAPREQQQAARLHWSPPSRCLPVHATSAASAAWHPCERHQHRRHRRCCWTGWAAVQPRNDGGHCRHRCRHAPAHHQTRRRHPPHPPTPQALQPPRAAPQPQARLDVTRH